jgi:hypothetical protein
MDWIYKETVKQLVRPGWVLRWKAVFGITIQAQIWKIFIFFSFKLILIFFLFLDRFDAYKFKKKLKKKTLF